MCVRSNVFEQHRVLLVCNKSHNANSKKYCLNNVKQKYEAILHDCAYI